MDQLQSPSGDRGLPKVDLGCTSLVLIAVIVGVCSGAEHRDARRAREEVRELRKSVERLEKKIDKLSPPAPATQTAPATPKAAPRSR